MSLKRTFLHVAVWSGVFTFWLIATRRHHPTLTIAILATAVLVAAFALAVYVNALLLRPRYSRLWLQYAVLLVATVAVLDLGAVLLIQFIYDRLWGPDPLRYGFWFNVASEGVLITIHLAAAMGVMRLAKHLRRRSKAVAAS